MNAAVKDIPQVPAKFVPEVIRDVTKTFWKLRAGAELFVLITAAMAVAKEMKVKEKVKEGEAPKQPPTLVPAIDLTSGEVGQFIVGSTLIDIFNDEYPKDAYVGKSFWIKLESQREAKAGGGRKYNTYIVKEIKTPDAFVKKPEAVKK